MNKIWKRAKDEGVSAWLIYADSSNKLASDSAGKNLITPADAIDCFLNGGVISTSKGFYRPIYWKETAGALSVVCVDNSGSSGALAAVVFTA